MAIGAGRQPAIGVVIIIDRWAGMVARHRAGALVGVR
jgi:hypothetical protein